MPMSDVRCLWYPSSVLFVRTFSPKTHMRSNFGDQYCCQYSNKGAKPFFTSFSALRTRYSKAGIIKCLGNSDNCFNCQTVCFAAGSFLASMHTFSLKLRSTACKEIKFLHRFRFSHHFLLVLFHFRFASFQFEGMFLPFG